MLVRKSPPRAHTLTISSGVSLHRDAMPGATACTVIVQMLLLSFSSKVMCLCSLHRTHIPALVSIANYSGACASVWSLCTSSGLSKSILCAISRTEYDPRRTIMNISSPFQSGQVVTAYVKRCSVAGQGLPRSFNADDGHYRNCKRPRDDFFPQRCACCERLRVMNCL